jgi:hypothetical protein
LDEKAYFNGLKSQHVPQQMALVLLEGQLISTATTDDAVSHAPDDWLACPIG